MYLIMFNGKYLCQGPDGHDDLRLSETFIDPNSDTFDREEDCGTILLPHQPAAIDFCHQFFWKITSFTQFEENTFKLEIVKV